MVHRWTRPSLVALCFAAASCAGTQEAPNADPFVERRAVDDMVTLTVQNNDFRDASIYAYWNGMRNRVGDVTGKTSKTFRIEWKSEQVQLGIDFVGGGGYTSERIDVMQGDHLNFTIIEW